MSKTSIIRHPESDRLIQVKKWQIDACDGQHHAAFVLSFIEYWTNVYLSFDSKLKYTIHGKSKREIDFTEQGMPMIPFTLEEITEGTLGLFGRNRVFDGVGTLLKKQFLFEHASTTIDRTKRYSLGIKNINIFIENYCGHRLEINDAKFRNKRCNSTKVNDVLIGEEIKKRLRRDYEETSSAKISHEILQGQKNDFSSQGEETKKEKKVTPKKEKKSEDPTSHLHKRFREIWGKFYLSKFQTEFVWGTTNAKGEYKASVHVFAIGSIAKQIHVKSVAAALGEITDARIENGFCFFIEQSYERADDFGKRNFTPNHLATKFNEYFTLIKSPKNATTQRTNGYDANGFRINPAMEVLNAIKSHQATTNGDTGLSEEEVRRFIATLD